MLVPLKFEWYCLHFPSCDDRDVFALCIMDGFRVVSAIAALKFTLYCSLYKKKAAACELHAAAIPAIIAVGSHIFAQKPRDARAHHVSAIAAIIAVGSHTIAQSDIRTSFSKENSELS